MWRTDSLEKALMLGRIEGRRRRGRQRMRWLDGITDSMDMSWVSSGSWWWTGKPGVLQSMGSQRVRHNWANELTDWLVESFCTDLKSTFPSTYRFQFCSLGPSYQPITTKVKQALELFPITSSTENLLLLTASSCNGNSQRLLAKLPSVYCF